MALRALADRLARAGVPAPEHDAEALLLHALGLPRAALWLTPDALLSAEELGRLERLAGQREGRVPLQLLLGLIPFHGVTLEVRPGVFIPRPETETLVEAALNALAAGPGAAASAAGRALYSAGGVAPPAGRLLDLGTGTGAVVLALLAALPGWGGTAVDRSPAALELAAQNAERNGLAGRLTLVGADFTDPAFSPPGSPFDLLLSNPPYVPRGAIGSLEPEVRDHDPPEALDGGVDGLDALRHLARGIDLWVRPGGLVVLEIGADQADPAMGMFGPHLSGIRVTTDLAGRPRVLTGRTRGRDA
jgi:release factor glutamine methyltransferase